MQVRETNRGTLERQCAGDQQKLLLRANFADNLLQV